MLPTVRLPGPISRPGHRRDVRLPCLDGLHRRRPGRKALHPAREGEDAAVAGGHRWWKNLTQPAPRTGLSVTAAESRRVRTGGE